MSGGVVAIVGNPNPGSRTLAIAELVARKLGELAAIDDAPHVIDVVEHGPSLLRWGDPSVASLKAEVLGSRALVVASPTYKAAYTGLLKLFLDQFDAGELHGIPTVAVMTGGSLAHALAVEVHLVPVLTEIGASCPARGLYLWGADLDAPEAAVDRWFSGAEAVLRRALAAAAPDG
jgi:FMN reductase